MPTTLVDILTACKASGITLSLKADGTPTAGPPKLLTGPVRDMLQAHRAEIVAHLQAQQSTTPMPTPEPEATEPDDDEPAAELWHPAVALTLIKQLATEIRTWCAVGGALAHSLGSTTARMAGDGFERQDMQWIRAAGEMLEDARSWWADEIWPDVGTVKELQAGLLATPSANPGELPIEGLSHYSFVEDDDGEAA